MIEYEKHAVFVEILSHGTYKATASVNTFTYPDGSSRSTGLDSDELREVGKMILEAADELEELEQEVNHD